MKTKKTYTLNLSFTSLLALAFIVLKLCGVIAWSWWWVLSPIWIPVAVGIAVLVAIIIVIAVANSL